LKSFSEMRTAITVNNISRSYGTVKALDGISFEVPQGELFGFIGPDGAGKTTLFRILATLVLPDEGTAAVEGYDVVRDFKKIRKILGYMPGRFSLVYGPQRGRKSLILCNDIRHYPSMRITT
jgi:ABC-2 type transport system ATP-binding protein